MSTSPMAAATKKHKKHKNRQNAEHRRYVAQMACAQINYYFSTDNLCQDTFLRSHFDELGYMPIAMVCNFPTVACYGAGYPEILECLKSSPVVEVDSKNETLRCKEDAEKWVFPNPPPRWIKQEVKQASPPPAMPLASSPAVTTTATRSLTSASTADDTAGADTDSSSENSLTSAGTPTSVAASPSAITRRGTRGSSTDPNKSKFTTATDSNHNNAPINPRTGRPNHGNNMHKTMVPPPPKKKEPAAPPPNFNMALDFPALQ